MKHKRFFLLLLLLVFFAVFGGIYTRCFNNASLRLHGTYNAQEESFRWISFDREEGTYFYYNFSDAYTGQFVHVGEKQYKITSGELSDSLVTIIDRDQISLDNRGTVSIYRKTDKNPTVIDQ